MRRRDFLLAAPAGLALLAGGRARASLLDDLYGNRLLFSEEGAPLVPVRMMERKDRVQIEGASGLVVESVGEDRRLEVPAGAPLVIERTGGRPARLDERWVIETLEGEARSLRQEARERWRARGVEVELVPAGGVYGVSGTVVDNRALLVTTRAPLPPGLAEAHGVRAVRMEWLASLPSLSVRVAVGDRAPLLVGSLARPAVLKVRPREGETLLVRQVEHSVGYAQHGFADRELRGEVLLVPDRGGRIAVVNIVPEDVLVAGILPSEMFATAPMEALKAQAVTARGELFAKIGRRHLADPYLVCSEQHCQVYKGRTAEHPRTNQAARETAGELSFLDGELVDSVYSACCGGHTEPAHIVWDRPKKRALLGRPDAPLADPAQRAWLSPAVAGSAFTREISSAVAAGTLAAPSSPVPLDLRREEDVRRFLELPREATFCGRSSFNQKGDAYRWSRRFTAPELSAAFADLGVGEVARLTIDERGPGGRLRSLLVEGTGKSARVYRELPVRRRLSNLRSGLFVIDEERDPAGRLVAVTLRGAGFGHGAGMCQQGAIGMAEAGRSYREILRHYYMGAEVRKVF